MNEIFHVDGPRQRGWDVQIIRSGRKTAALEIHSDGSILLRAPFEMEGGQIRALLKEKSAWIDRHWERFQKERAEKQSAPPQPRLTMDELQALANRALVEIPPRVQYYAGILGVTYGRITIRNQTTRWGSCSSKGNLNFNCLLMLMPPEMVDYTIVHELCHRKEMNHSPAFWSLVASVLPDYPQRSQWMKEHGEAIMRRMRG